MQRLPSFANFGEDIIVAVPNDVATIETIVVMPALTDRQIAHLSVEHRHRRRHAVEEKLQNRRLRAQGVFGLFTRGGIQHRTDVSRYRAVGIQQRADVHAEPLANTIRREIAIFKLAFPSLAERNLAHACHVFAIIRMDAVHPFRAQGLFSRPPGDGAPALIDIRHLAGRVSDEDADRRQLGEGVEAFFGLPQRLVGRGEFRRARSHPFFQLRIGALERFFGGYAFGDVQRGGEQRGLAMPIQKLSGECRGTNLAVFRVELRDEVTQCAALMKLLQRLPVLLKMDENVQVQDGLPDDVIPGISRHLFKRAVDREILARIYAGQRHGDGDGLEEQLELPFHGTPCLFRLLTLGDIAIIHHHRADRRCIEQVLRGRVYPAVFPVGVLQAELRRESSPRRLQQMLKVFLQRRQVVGMDNFKGAMRGETLKRVAIDPRGGRTGIEEPPRRIKHDNGILGMLDQGAKALFTGPQRIFRPHALGNVLRGGE